MKCILFCKKNCKYQIFDTTAPKSYNVVTLPGKKAVINYMSNIKFNLNI